VKRLELDSLQQSLESTPLQHVTGRVVRAVGPVLEAELPPIPLGALVEVEGGCDCEVVGFRDQHTLLVPLNSTAGVAHGARVVPKARCWTAPTGDQLLGRVLDGLGRPIDDGPPLTSAGERPIQAPPIRPMSRTKMSEPLATGIKVIDGMLPLAVGQRIAVTAGSGVGKSTLLGMFARFVEVDVVVVNLVGERGREVREFVENEIDEATRQRAVVIASTSDRSPIEQIKSTYVATTIAESFRDEGKRVLLLVDSLTRLALAQRQIGLAAGEPPTTRGYTPSVFSILPPLLERAGPGQDQGSITAVYSVLVEADDENDPIADTVRGIVDGHVVLSRELASHGHYPAVDVLSSLSRIGDRVSSPEHRTATVRFRHLLATWKENEELVRLGAYRKGTSPIVDEAIHLQPAMSRWLKQEPHTCVSREESVRTLSAAVSAKD